MFTLWVWVLIVYSNFKKIAYTSKGNCLLQWCLKWFLKGTWLTQKQSWFLMCHREKWICGWFIVNKFTLPESFTFHYVGNQHIRTLVSSGICGLVKLPMFLVVPFKCSTSLTVPQCQGRILNTSRCTSATSLSITKSLLRLSGSNYH